MPVIQWFPGHMAKARRVLQENAPLVDVILEVVDARCPQASSNPDLMQLVAHKSQIKVLNKADLSDGAATRGWLEYFRRRGELAVAIDAVKGTGAKEVIAAIREAFAPKLAEWTAKGRKPRPARAMAVGIPNVGKSSVINRLVGARKAIVGDKPGVTRGKQWVRIGGDVELLDMPGILVPKFENQWDGVLLAAIGSIKDEVYDQMDVVNQLLPYFWEQSRTSVAERLGLTELSADPTANIEAIGRHRGLLRAGGTVEADKVAFMILREFREGRLGRISLERADNGPGPS
ncbi:MAG TPA: ribosome biogenesis GTPase YlqF [Symbiobacteriaceae bacterium]|nr:ribosome biogenesis GTPase YlqF [Symbiobacteriaceae bacterium]